MTTVKDVAKLAGVSTATVSRVVNNSGLVNKETQSKVQSAMQQLNYRPNTVARALASKKCTTLGLVVPDVSDPFFGQLASSVEQITRLTNMQLLLSIGGQDERSEQQAIESLVAQNCDTMVVHSKKMSDNALSVYLNDLPGLVLINRFIAEYQSRCIWLNNEYGGQLAAEYLVSKGHKQIALINSCLEIDDPLLRKKGFENALLSENLYFEAAPTFDGGEEATLKLIEHLDKITAIFAYNDAMAMGIISKLSEKGIRVPKDISIIGFDDALFARVCQPKLTTLRYPIDQMAKHAALLSLSLSGANTEFSNLPSEYCYQPYLIERNSVSLNE
ncbi:DNA-binding transcriptional regulator GalS [Shewanella sp. OPT22]|nr:DNA-binding transcriptional regulator GalS [Shewanella sp. OPT22]